jgi:hypothetical protein
MALSKVRYAGFEHAKESTNTIRGSISLPRRSSEKFPECYANEL